MIKRLFAIGFIFTGVSVAWMVLAGATYTRTHTADSSLKSRVAQLWGAPQVQLPPHIATEEKIQRKVESTENGKKVEVSKKKYLCNVGLGDVGVHNQPRRDRRSRLQSHLQLVP